LVRRERNERLFIGAGGHKIAAVGEERGEATEIIPAKRRQADLALLAFMRR
jgi:hypothetical protein